MKVVWMIFFFKERSISEHKSYAADEIHNFTSLEPWDDNEYDTEEDALGVLVDSLLDKDDKVVILKVYS